MYLGQEKLRLGGTMLTEEELRPFVGGQVWIESEEGFLFCGEIRDLLISDRDRPNELIIKLEWLARNTGYLDREPRWVKDENPRRPHKVLLSIASITRLPGGRVRLEIPGEATIMRPQGDAVFLERRLVEDL